MRLINRFTFHPFLLAIYPVLALLAENFGEVSAWVVLRPFLVSLIGCGIMLGLLSLIHRNTQRAALVSSLALFAFFSYGHVYTYLSTRPIFGITLGHNRYLAPIYLLIIVVGIWLILRQKRYLSEVNLLANGIAIVLVLMPMLQMGIYAIRQTTSSNLIREQTAESNQLKVNDPMVAPDIYYIILDTYTRQDVLKTKFGIDTSSFIDGLRQLGFFVVDCANANYPSTNVSLASSLNFNYLQEINANLPAGATLDTAMSELLRHNQVRNLLEQAGYYTVAFATGYDWIEWKDSDSYLQPDDSGRVMQSLRPFEAMLIQSTAVTILLDAQSIFLPELTRQVANPNEEHIQRQTFLLEKLENMASMPGPKFVYAHILIPHGPFVFNADGSLVADPSYYENGGEERFIEGYRNQVQFINQRLMQILPRLINESRQPPIIIIQSDHGPKQARFQILNAYYLPGVESKLYSDISPVNSFRLVFDQYFGTDYGLLPDHYFQVNGDDLMEFSVVVPEATTTCPTKVK
jgi:hypothetical protein